MGDRTVEWIITRDDVQQAIWCGACAGALDHIGKSLLSLPQGELLWLDQSPLGPAVRERLALSSAQQHVALALLVRSGAGAGYGAGDGYG